VQGHAATPDIGQERREGQQRRRWLMTNRVKNETGENGDRWDTDDPRPKSSDCSALAAAGLFSVGRHAHGQARCALSGNLYAGPTAAPVLERTTVGGRCLITGKPPTHPFRGWQRGRLGDRRCASKASR
jgi:hypothetical protein